MRLSDEIMLGATLERHIAGQGPIREGDGGCALQLACLARGDQKKKWSLATFSAHPWTSQNRKCPACVTTSTARYVIYHLNDQHAWTIEQIADWVRSVEPAEPEAESPVTREVEVVRD